MAPNNFDSEFAFTIADNDGGYTNNFNGSVALGPGIATVNNYNTTVDDISFNDNSWGDGRSADFGPGTYEGLVDTQGNHPGDRQRERELPGGPAQRHASCNKRSGDAINLVVYDPLVFAAHQSDELLSTAAVVSPPPVTSPLATPTA